LPLALANGSKKYVFIINLFWLKPLLFICYPLAKANGNEKANNNQKANSNQKANGNKKSQ
jgi:hypothetical protein